MVVWFFFIKISISKTAFQISNTQRPVEEEFIGDFW
jgi:hypothetical protein